MRYLYSIIALLFSSTFLAQSYNMSNTAVSTCSGTFYDSGGAGSNYGYNQNFTKTFCPSTPGSRIQFNFTSFSLENSYDFMTIYDGNSTAAPTLGTYTGAIGPGLIQASAANPTGCITFVFTSDGNFLFPSTMPGWSATIACLPDCQTTVPAFTTVPAAVAGIVKVCLGASVTFNAGSTTYPINNTGYTQSNATTTFNWNFGNGATGTGISPSVTYAAPGIYIVRVNTVDVQGCTNTIIPQITVEVAAASIMTGSFVTSPTICLGQTNTLSGVATPQTISLNCTPSTPVVIFLPDGAGASYSSPIAVNCFAAGQTMTAASNISNICATLEHSYLGDLDIAIQCPNGQTISLHNYGTGAGIYLGSPLDDPAVGPGVGAQYCFTPSSPTLLYNGATNLTGSPAANSINAGNYMPAASFAGLIGCPLNGAWTIIVTDHLGADNGYIFNWDINFTVPPVGVTTFTPTIASQGWLANPAITSTAGNTITVTPTTTGIQCFTYRATDNFGCIKDTVICFNVLPLGSVGCPSCLITNFTANSTLPNCGNQWTTTGTITFTSAPATGQLTVVDCQGNSVVVASAPFTSPYNYTLTGTDANGLACFFTASFTALPACNSQINFTYAAADPADEAGTVTSSQAGPGLNVMRICQTGSVTVNSNDNDVIPPIAPGNDPNVVYFLYSCPPLPGGVGIQPPNDPCYEGFLTTEDITLINTNGLATPLFAGWGAMNNNTFYIVPMTLGTVSGLTYHQDCYDLALDQMTTVQFLNPIVPVITQNCALGTATVTFTGGNPQFYGGNFIASSLLPATASFANTTCLNGGAIVINGLTNGQVWSYNITDANGCPITVTGTFTGLQNPAFTYPLPGYCRNAANPSPTITGLAGGTFTSAPAGLSINAASGLINLAASTVGAYTITYTTPGPTCQGSTTFALTVYALPIVNAGTDQTVCIGSSVTLSGAGASTYTWTGGVTNGVSFVPPIGTTNYTATGTSINGCVGTDIVAVTVNPLPVVGAGADQTICVGAAVTLSGSGASTYVWAGPMAVTNGVAFNPPVGVHNFTVTGSSATIPACTNTDIVVITVNAIPVVSAGPDVSVCIAGSITLSGSGATTYTWTGGVTNGVAFVPPGSGNYTVTGTTLGCSSTDLVAVSVLANAPINAGPDVTVCAGISTTLTASGGVSYTWNNGLGAGNNFSVTPAVTTIYTVNGADANGCTGTDQMTVFVNPLPIVGAGPDQTVCQGVATTLTGTGATSYVWTGGITNALAFTQVVGAINYTVTGTTLGCSSTDIVTVTVNPLPVINAGIDQTVCAGVSATLTAVGAPTIVWNNGISNAVSFTPAATLNYTATGTSASGCVSTDIVTVTVNPLPLVNAGLDQTVCSGTAVTLAGAGANNGYVWSNGVVNNVAFTPAVGTVVYTVTGTNLTGCQNTDVVNVTVNPNPAPIINGAVSYCVGSSSTLSTSIPFTTYSWSTPALTSTTNVTTANNPITVTVQNAFGCSGTSPAFIVTQTSITTANSNVTVCQGIAATIHGVPQTVAGVYSQTFIGGSVTGCDSVSIVTLTVNPLPNVNAGADQTACIGSNITLTGTNALTYAWNNAVVNGVSFVPAVGSVTYTLTGTDANGCVNTDQVVVLINPLPIITAVADYAICATSATTLVGAGAGAGTYVWNNGVTNNVAFTPIATNTYTVTGTDVNGCVNTDQVIVTVNPLPIVNAGLDQQICDVFTTSLSGAGAVSYVWTNGVLDGVIFNPIVGTINYTVTGTDVNGCIDTDMVQIIVNPMPIVNAGLDQIICSGQTATLTGSGAGVGANYLWNNGVINASAFTPAVGALNYVVTGTNANGCVDTDTVNILVNALPIINAGLDQVICIGESVTLTGSNGNTYVWNNGVLNAIALSPIATNTYTVTGTDVNGCVDTDQVLVTVNVLPVVNAGNDLIVCNGTTALLTGSGASMYVWTNAVTDGVAFTPAGTNSYTVTGTDVNGCIDTDVVTVTVENAPAIAFTPDNVIGCTPVTVTFTNTTTGATTTTWIFNDGTTVSGNGDQTHTFTAPGCYDIVMIAESANGCTSTFTATDMVCVEAYPLALFTASPNTMTNIFTEVEFDNNSIGADMSSWTFGDDTQSNQTNPTHVYPNAGAGSYLATLIVSTNYGCTDTISQMITITEEVIFYVPNTFTPDDDKFNEGFMPIFTSGFDPQDYEMFIFDRWGETIFETHDTTVGWRGSYGVGNVDIVQDGTYIWRIEFKAMNGKRILKTGHVNVLR